MGRLLLAALLVCMFGGCVQMSSSRPHSASRGAKSAFWGSIKEPGGTEYLRMGNLTMQIR
jgi:hypothetical protein